VIGGLFFGHSDAGVFSDQSERLIEGIASQAAIAMGNARLFEEMKRTNASWMSNANNTRVYFTPLRWHFDL
jgi:transcriptional regulator with GAF, ATPase, and Fis domain